MLIVEKRGFINGQNGDTDPKYVDDKSLLNLMNARVGRSEYGREDRIENVPGTTRINNSVYPPYGYHLYLGSATNEGKSWIVYCLWNSFGDHGIYCLDLTDVFNPITYAVLYDSQVIGGLGFSKDFRIDKDATIIGNLFYFTDNNADPRRINIESGIKMNQASFVTDQQPYSYPMNAEVLTVIRRPPNYPLTFEKKVASDIGITISTNQIKDNVFRFAMFFTDYNGEETTISFHSLLAPYNYANENFDIIQITVPFAQQIDQWVQIVVIVVYYADGEKAFEIHRWDKDNADDLAAIQAHNSSTTPLVYNFANSEVGTGIDSLRKTKPFDSVPLKSKTLSIADGRLFLGNNLMGYDSPLQSSLIATAIRTTQGSGGTGNFLQTFAQYHQDNVQYDTPIYIIFYVATAQVISGVTYVAGYYQPAISPPPVPAAENLATAIYIGTQDNDILDWIYNQSGFNPGYNPSVSGGAVFYIPYPAGSNIPITGSTTALKQVLKSNAPYRIAIVFYDKFMRQCGVVFKSSNLITTPSRAYNTATYDYAIQWTLSNLLSIDEIPDWAYFYSIVATNNLRTSFFMQARAGQVRYATKDANGLYLYTQTTYAPNNSGIAVRLDVLQGNGMGYVFNQGDAISIYTDTNISKNLSVLAQDGEWVIVSLSDIGTVTTLQAFFELYTPADPAAGQFYFEQAQMFPVINPTQSNRQYSTTQGTIAGDVYLITRNFNNNDYITENMSPNDNFWQKWFTNAGRIQLIDKIGQRRLKTGVRFSETYITGTIVNGLSSFDALNQKILQSELDEVNKLQLANKIDDQGQGNIMLAICTSETVSMYIGEVQLMAAAQRGDISTVDSVIGSTNVLKGSYGTINKESVIEYLGLVFWIDALNNTVVQYASNGLQPVSEYKENRFFKRYLSEYINANSNNLDNINGFHHLPTCVDPFHKELICTLPGLIYQNYANILPSYSSVPSYATSIINRFDIFDRLGKTMCFDFVNNKWDHNFEFMAEGYEYLQNTLIAFKNGIPYIHESDKTNWNNFYGVQYPVRVIGVANLNPSLLKDLANVAIESNAAPNFSVAMALYPDIQITDLSIDDYKNIQGIFYASWLRDRLSPNNTGTADQRLFIGDQLTDMAILWMLEFQQNNALFYINFVNIGWDASKGNQAIAMPANK